ncbi:protein mab-21-like 2 [Watersipora subatra]|uniref:protein mab-21-like 2 n=1 Tax=Watersipora subatra TaxID=2589382 RepID=UPI00355B45D7
MNCMYHNSYSYASVRTPIIDTGLLVEGHAAPLPVYDTPSPSHHSSDGSTNAAMECCQTTENPYTAYAHNSSSVYQLNNYWHEKVMPNKMAVQQSVEEVGIILQNILRQVEIEEPRFSCTLNKTTRDRYDGLTVDSPTEFSILLYLNHMAVFSFIDEGSVPGCAALKLSDGRKRSMSLWIEFITASGYLSARKIRSKFFALVAQVLEKNKYSGVRIAEDANDVIIIIKETYKVHVSPAFAWKGTWPGAVANWVIKHQLAWPSVELANEIMVEGITLVSRESIYMKDKQTSSEGDAWLIEFTDAEERLMYSYDTNRKKILSILKCLRDRHLQVQSGSTITNHHLKTLLLFEGEKHPCDSEWQEDHYADRIHSVLLQLTACLQSHECLHYFQPGVNLFKGLDKKAMGVSARAVWAIIRRMAISKYCWDEL